jgi:hypothetical protein
MDICEPHRKHRLRHRFYCCMRVLRALSRNGSTVLLVAYLLRAYLPSRSLTMGLHVTIHLESLKLCYCLATANSVRVIFG